MDKKVKTLGSESTKIYNNVTKKVPKNTKASVLNSTNKVLELMHELGGVKNFTKEEKRLMNMLKDETVTFATLERERRAVGEAIGRIPQGKYANSDKSFLKKIYGALKEDQLDTVESVLGSKARKELGLADRTFQQKMALEKRIANVFGNDGEKSITPLLNNMISQGSKGNITALNKALNVIPKEYRSEAIISAITNNSLSKVASKPMVFDFNRFSTMYEGLRRNKPIWQKMAKELSTEQKDILNNLHIVSKRVAEAKSNKLTTGKAMQRILEKFNEVGPLQKVVQMTVNLTPTGRIAKGLGFDFALEKLFHSGKDRMRAVSDLIKTQEFRDLTINASKGMPVEELARKLTSSKAFKKWAGAIGQQIKNPQALILESLTINENQNKGKEWQTKF